MKGFIALMSVLIVSILLLGLALGGATITFFSRFNELDRESYEHASDLAQSCAATALLQLAQNYSYSATHQAVSFANDRCYIESVTVLNSSATQKEVQIQTSAAYISSFATYTAVALIQNPSSSTPTQQNPPVFNIIAY